MRRILRLLSLGMLLIGVSGAPLFAQSAQVSGRVTDPAAGPVPGVTVTVVNEATGMTRTTSTNDEGYYAVPALPPGPYG